MAKRFLPPPATFADGNYPAGANAWNAQPRAVALTDSEKASGFTPKTPRAPEIDNGLWREYHIAEAVLAHQAMKSWSLTMASDGANVMQCFGVVENNISSPNGSEKWLIVLGNNFFDLHMSPDVAWTGQANSGQAYINATHRTNVVNINPAQVVGALNGGYLARVDNVDGKIYYGNIISATLSTDSTFVSAGQTMKMVGYIGTGIAGKAVAVLGVGTSNVMRYSATMGGGAWSSATFPASIAKAYELAQTPSGSIAVFSCKVGTTPQLFYSTDLGVTWTHAATMSTGAQPGALCYSEAMSLFLYLEDSTGNIWSSADGATWVIVASAAPRSVASGGTAGINAVQQALAGQHMMASAGPCLARVIQRSDGTNIVQGVAYTFDLINWNFTGLCNVSLSSILGIEAVDGRFVVAVSGSAEDALIMSGMLEAPAIDFA